MQQLTWAGAAFQVRMDEQTLVLAVEDPLGPPLLEAQQRAG